MRRSAAPSQLQGNPFKKLKFIPPGRSNPSLDEENTKSPDVKLLEAVASKNTFLQLQNNPRICSSNLPTDGSAREINHGHNNSGKHYSEASVMATLDPPHTVQTWMRKHRLVRVHYR